MPYTRCYRASRVCRMSDDSRRCVACIEARKVCDGNSVASHRAFFSRGVSLRADSGVVTRAVGEQKKVEADLEKSDKELQELLARRARLQR